VGHDRLELSANGLRGPVSASGITQPRAEKGDRGDGISRNLNAPVPIVPSAPVGDPLEHALSLAAAAGRFDIVAQLGKELEARRLALTGVATLDAMRMRRRHG
jgi:hypothetical protein